MTDSPLRGVRAVVLDLDGTLLPASKRLTDRTVGVVRDVVAAGIHVSLATGKGWNHTDRYATELGLETPQVALEGALVALTGHHRGRGRALHRSTLSADALRRIEAAVADLDLGFFFCTDRWRTRAHRRLEPQLGQLRVWDPHVDLVERFLEEEQCEEAFVLHFVGDQGEIDEAAGRLAPPEVRGSAQVVRFEFWDGLHQIQLRPAGVGKHTGLAHALRHLGAEPREMLACGDWLNDVEMLRMAGTAVAPANAVPEAKAVADHVLPGTCEEDAVADFLAAALRAL